MSGAEAISPTAHYTGYVWFRAGLSHPALATGQGRLLFETLQPAMRASRLLSGPTLESYLLARHRAIDALLERAIERDGVSQVIEVACGLSPRGWRFAQRYGERLLYIEADLPQMAARKHAALQSMGALTATHRVAELDARRDAGAGSLDAIAAELAPDRGLAIITEGLLGYLPGREVEALWRRFATALRNFDTGRYLSDLHLGGAQTPVVRAFRALLAAFVRGRVHLHFTTAEAARRALLAHGFDAAEVVNAALVGDDGVLGAARNIPPGHGADLAHIIEASTR